MANRDEYLGPPTNSLRPKMRGEEETTGMAVSSPEQPVNDGAFVGLMVVGAIVAFLILRRLWKKPSGRYEEAVSDDALPPLDLPPKPRQFHSKPARPLPKSHPKRFNEGSSTQLPKPRFISGTAWVTDGDTIVINKTQIRLFGIDAPELDHPFGQKAKWAMVKLCKGHEVRAEITDVDHYGRSVAHCTLPDGRDLSAEMVKMGLAIDWPTYSGGKYRILEAPGVRKKLWLANARQAGKLYLWEQFEYNQRHVKKD